MTTDDYKKLKKYIIKQKDDMFNYFKDEMKNISELIEISTDYTFYDGTINIYLYDIITQNKEHYNKTVFSEIQRVYCERQVYYNDCRPDSKRAQNALKKMTKDKHGEQTIYKIISKFTSCLESFIMAIKLGCNFWRLEYKICIRVHHKILSKCIVFEKTNINYVLIRSPMS